MKIIDKAVGEVGHGLGVLAKVAIGRRGSCGFQLVLRFAGGGVGAAGLGLESPGQGGRRWVLTRFVAFAILSTRFRWLLNAVLKSLI